MIESPLLLASLCQEEKRNEALAFYERFSNPVDTPCYLFGFNRYAHDLLRHFRISGIVDDFTAETLIEGVPVIRSGDIPPNALVLSLSGGRPVTVRALLRAKGVSFLDYFTFRRIASEELCEIYFNEGFASDFARHHAKYEWVYGLLADEESRTTFQRLVSFRWTGDVDFMEGFRQREDEQYFEPFLALQRQGETFVDIGGFDGFTSNMFADLCPEFRAIHLFEPDPRNMELSKARLAKLNNVFYHPFGLSDVKGEFRMASNQSASVLSDEGDIVVKVDLLDEVLKDDISFIKMDTEGAELNIIRGAKDIIKRRHPRLAIAAYHYSAESAPFWQIPEQVFAIRDDYELYVRHYTESIYETVMFYIPKS